MGVTSCYAHLIIHHQVYLIRVIVMRFYPMKWKFSLLGPFFSSAVAIRGLLGAVLLSLIGLSAAQAGVVVGGTRLIYQAASKEGALSINNPEKTTPYLIQSWVDNFQEKDSKKVPFIITPPLFRLDAGQENVLRIVYTGNNLPQDRESIFWLNVKSIPATAASQSNQLQISVKTRIKLIYRPAGLSESPETAYQKLVFSRQGGRLTAHNPTPFYISFYALNVNGKDVDNPGMVAPGQDSSWSAPANAGGKVTWSAINDFGGISPSASGVL